MPQSTRRAAIAVFAVFAFNGFQFASWASRLPAIRDALGVTPAQLGFVLLIGVAGSLVALPLTGIIVDRIGSARTTRLAVTLAGVGLAGLAGALFVGSVALAVACLFVATMGIGAWDVSMNLQGTVIERRRGRAIMPRFHAGFSIGAVVGAALGALSAAIRLPVWWHILLISALAMVSVRALTRCYLPDAPHPRADQPGEHAPASTGLLAREVGSSPASSSSPRAALAAWREPRTVLIGLLVMAAALSEGAANDWLTLAVVDGFTSSQAAGALVFGIFVSAMTVVRLAGTRLLDRFGRAPVLRACSAIGLLGLMGFGLSPTLPMAVVGVVLWGVGAGLGFPVGLSAAADDPARAAARVSVVSSIAYLAFLAGPPLLGMLAGEVGYRSALLTIALPLIASFFLSPVAAPLRERTRPVGAGAAAAG